MKKITLLLLCLFMSVCGYSQLATEGFENTTGITGPLPAYWQLGATDPWAVFQNNYPDPASGTTESWGINAFANGIFHQGTQAASVNREQLVPGNTSEDFLATPLVSIGATGVTELHFWTRMFTSGNQGTIYRVMVANGDNPDNQTNPLAYLPLQEWTENDLIIPTSNFNVWTEKTVNLTAAGLAGRSVYIAFVKVYTQTGTGVDGDRWLIDDVGIDVQCTAPVTAGTLVTGSTTATLNWLNPNNVGQWQIEILTGTQTQGQGIIINYTGTAPTYPVTSLLPNTTYRYYIKAICSSGFSSPWSAVSANFTTQIAPPVCGGNLVDSGGPNGNYSNNENVSTTVTPAAGQVVTVTFTAFNTQANTDFLKIYDGPNTSFPLLANLSGTTLPPSYTATSASGALTFVFTSNGSTVAAGYAANITCGPPPACRIPTAVTLTAGSVTTTTATISWEQPQNPDGSTATQWQVLPVTPCTGVAPSAGPAPTAQIANTNSNFIVTGLTPASCYDVWVRSVCGSTTSAWSLVPVTLSTLVAPPVCGGNFVDSGGISGNYSNNENLTTVICPVTTGHAVTVTFTSFNIQNGSDFLRVYDGNGTSGTLLATLTGTTLPPAFTSSATGGCLTFVFTSNATTVAAGWVANVTCAPPPACTPPVAVSAGTPTYNSVPLTWTQPANPDGSTPTSWHVLSQPCTAPAPTATATGYLVANTNTNFPVTGLTSNACNSIYVRSACTSTWVGPINVTTPIAPPMCGGNFVDAGGTTAGYAANSNVTTTICPNNPGDVVTVTFTAFDTEATYDALYVYNGTGVVPANIIPSTNPAGNVPGGLAGGYWGQTLPCPFISSAADGCLTFVFRSDGSVQNAGWVANITCAPPPPCRIPTSVIATGVTHNSAVLNWTQPTNPDGSVAAAWDIIAVTCGSPAPAANATPTHTAITNINYLLAGLSSATCYDIYVRANCGSGLTSAWPCLPVTITTLVAPPVCGGNFVDAGGVNGNYANNSNITTIICPNSPGEIVTVTFTLFNTEANWDGLYVYDGNTVNPGAQIASANGAGNVPGGIAGSFWGNLTGQNLPGPFTSTSGDGCLTFVFRSDGSGVNPGWVANVTCTPAPTCARPIITSAQPITQTTASLTWTQPASPNGTTPTAWEVLILPAGSPVPTGPGIPWSSTTYPIAGLQPGTPYVAYVRAICSGTDASTWAIYNFATKPVNDECANATFAIVNQNLNCVQTTHGTLAGATGSTPATTCGGAGAANDDVWFTFTATAATHIISFNNVTPATAISYAIYSGSCTGLTQVACNSGAGLTSGTTYYIRVFSTGTAPVFSEFDMCIGTLPCTEAPAFCTGQTVTYANATNVPSLGSIGCLGTSPNPAFFFLQVNQAGPLSYLISQVDNAGVGRDVDYVAWGPFTDLNSACSGVPANPLPAANPIPTPASGCPGTIHACSYSIAPQEIMCIPNAQLCQVYVIMITNFSNQAGTVTFTQTNNGGGTTACFPINTFNYSQTNYCQNQPNPTPVLANGATAGVYTSTPGLVIDPATGTINLAASTPGAYVITSTSATTIGGTCTSIPFITTTRTVIITAPASATIAYPNSPYCNSISQAQPVVRTGTTGGTYSASPAGLLINATTGDIIPVASQPGVYTVTYTVAATGGCPAFTTTAQVEILQSPVVNQSNVVACDSFTLPALTVGGYFSQAGGVGPVDPSIPITSNQTLYIYAVHPTNGCITEKSFTVTINTVPAPTYTTTDSTCTSPTGSITVTSPVAAGSARPTDLFISEVTDAATGSLTYVEIYNGTGNTVNLGNYKLKVYNNGNTTTSCDLTLLGTMPNNTVKVISVGSATNVGGVVPNLVFAACGGVNTDDNIRLTTLAGVEVDLWGRTDGTVFTPGGATGYTYRRLNTVTAPSLTWNPADWTALDPEDYTNVGTYAFTVSQYEYSIDNGPFQSNPVFSPVTPGTHPLVVKDLTTGCLSAPVDVIINAVGATTPVTGFTYATPVCKNDAVNPLPIPATTALTPGGTFTSTPSANIDINATTGEITLANTDAGTYVIRYATPFDPATCRSAGFTDFTIVINPVITPVVGFSYTTPICKNAQATLSPTLVSGFTLGGTFSSTPGLAINGTTGVIDLANSTAGSYTVSYVVAANTSTCQVTNTGTATIVIRPIVTLPTSFSYDSPFCATTGTEAPNPGTGFTAGGTYSSTAGLIINPTTGVIDLSSTPGTYTVTYTVTPNTANCEIATPGTTTVVIVPPVTIDLKGGCEGVKYVLTALPINGSFDPQTATYSWEDSTGIAFATTQSIDVPASGTYTVTVTVNGCSTESLPFNVDSVNCVIQKGISVNNDGLNDTFDLTGYDVKKLTIFNRLGMKVYSRANYINEWGGKSDDGDDLPDGTYYFIIDRNSGETKTGWIYINRAQ